MKITIEIDTETKTATVTDDHEQKRIKYVVAAFEWRNEVHAPGAQNVLLFNPRQLGEPTGRSWVNMTLDQLP